MSLFDWFKKKEVPQKADHQMAEPFTKKNVWFVQMDVSLGGETFFSCYASLDGSLMRDGVAGMPPIGISSLVQFPGMFEQIISRLPDEIFLQALEHRRPDIEHPLTYKLTLEGLFYHTEGGKQVKERRKQTVLWEDEPMATERHRTFRLLDQSALIMQGLSNDWIFDVVTLTCLDLKSDCMPEGMISQRKTEPANLETWERMLAQIHATPNGQFLLNVPEGKIFTDAKTKERKTIELFIENDKVAYRFQPYLG